MEPGKLEDGVYRTFTDLRQAVPRIVAVFGFNPIGMPVPRGLPERIVVKIPHLASLRGYRAQLIPRRVRVRRVVPVVIVLQRAPKIVYL